MASVRLLASGCALGAACFLLAGAAAAQTVMRAPGGPQPGRPMLSPGVPSGGFGPPGVTLRDALFGSPFDNRRRNAPPVARYISETGDGFTLDRSSGRPLLKFDGSGEVFALEAQAAPRGDIIYKNDLGETMLRATRLGGLTVFTEDAPSGAAAALMGSASPLRLQSIGPEQLLAVLAAASERASRAAKRLIAIEADASPRSAPLIADAAGRAADAVVALSRKKDGRKIVDRISKIVIGEGGRPEAVMHTDGVVRISVAPDMGLAGRPSSDRITLVASGKK